MTILTPSAISVRAASGSWQQQMKWAIRDFESLEYALGLTAESSLSCGPEATAAPGIKPSESRKTKVGSKIQAAVDFPVFVPLPFLARIEPGNRSDPLLRQVLPLPAEDTSPDGFSTDPLGEADATLSPGLLQKYPGRVLLITTGACAIHCRYCFRRHFPYTQSPSSLEQWIPALQQIEADPSIDEVILSGGDPLTLVDSMLERLVERIAAIRHVTRLRIHTRLPIMIPQRVTPELLLMLRRYPGQSILVIHANHAHELDDRVGEALLKIRDSGTTLLNQTVLLRGVNDDDRTLVDLSKRLLQCHTLPYYLHQLDPISGTAHFEVSQQRGRELVNAMRRQLPGYAVPRYVKELAGEQSKTPWE